MPTLNPVTLAASGAIFAGSLAILRYINKSQAIQTEAEIQTAEKIAKAEMDLISIAGIFSINSGKLAFFKLFQSSSGLRS